MDLRQANLIFVLVFSICLPAQADIYKCSKNGKIVYGDKPCGTDTKIVRNITSKTPSNVTSNESPIKVGARTCSAEAPRHVVFKDPNSVQIGTVTGGAMDVIPYADASITARGYSVPVNAKNSYGGYVGVKPILCFTSEDGRRVLKVNDILLN